MTLEILEADLETATPTQRAIHLEYQSQDAKAEGAYHVADCLFMAAQALRRGDEVTAEVWIASAKEEQNVLTVPF
jgi:hypothetical protein